MVCVFDEIVVCFGCFDVFVNNVGIEGYNVLMYEFMFV